MWQLFLQQLARDVQRQTLKQGGEWGPRAMALVSIGGLSKPEAYADRINREFGLRNYAKAWAIYDSNPAYWEKLYGDDPLTSPHHPASPPKSLLPRQSGASDPGYNPLNPAATGVAFGPFSTGGQFVPGSTTSSRPLYEAQSFVPPPIGSTRPDTIDDSKSVRRLGGVGETPGATVFDTGAAAVPFVSPSAIPRPGGSATFNERFQASLPPTNAPPSAAALDDLEAFRRQWIKAFMEP